MAKKKGIKEKAKKLKIIKKTKLFKIILSAGRVFSNAKEAFNLYEQGRFGEPHDGKIFYSLIESLYLLERKKASVYLKNRGLSYDKFIEEAEKLEKNFYIRYSAYKDMRNRGYLVKTALKFGADFRIYDKGVKPGEEHAKWILYPVHETTGLTWYEFAAKNRVAHSTKKNLWIAIVDDEGDVTYYEIAWRRP